MTDKTPPTECPKCDGAGWLRGHELDGADMDTQMDTMTKYPCDACRADYADRAPDTQVAPSPPRTFSDFIRNATEDEKRVIYERVMREVDASQAAIVHAALNPVAPDSLVARLRAMSGRAFGAWPWEIALQAADRIEQLQRERDELVNEKKARSQLDPITRMHNLCDGLAEHRHESPYDEKSWELADESYKVKCAELKAAESRLERVTQALPDEMEDFGEAAALVGKLGHCKTNGDMLALVLHYRHAILKPVRAALAKETP